jgi:hypothetical protein
MLADPSLSAPRHWRSGIRGHSQELPPANGLKSNCEGGIIIDETSKWLVSRQ